MRIYKLINIPTGKNSNLIRYISKNELHDLSKLKPKMTVVAIGFDWLVIFLSIALSTWIDSIFAYLLAIVCIGGRQHALAVLSHDFAHHRFLKNKQLSEWVGDIFTAWPVLMTVDSYRNTHMQHHHFTNTNKDPDFTAKTRIKTYQFPLKPSSLIITLSSYLLSIRSLQDILSLHTKKIQNTTTKSYVFKRIAFYITISIIIFLTGTWVSFVLYWLVPYFTLFFLFNYIRGIAEHFSGMDYTSLIGGTRTVLPFFWEKALFSPHNVNYHTEHHIYASVPFYNLPKLHKKLMLNPDYAAKAHITRGYSKGLTKEILSDKYE